MSVPISPPLRRYRRRILGWGLLGVAALCGVGAPLFLRGVERDLERRVPSELEQLGFAGVSAAFSGQDGVLSCATPLADPEDAIDAAIDVWGVRAIELDRSCRVSRQDEDAGEDVDVSAGTDVSTLDSAPPGATAGTADDTGSGTSDATSPTGSSASSVPAGEPADFPTIVDVVATGPQFSILASLLDEAGVADTLAGDGPFTLFAPSNEAFEALSADMLAQLRQDTDRLAGLLRHHAVAGSHSSDELTAGELETLDGDTLTVTVASGGITVADASVTESDISAGNGIVHVIDRVLLPGSIVTEPADRVSIVSATLTVGRLVLTGTVATDAQHAALIGAASAVVDPANVDDQLAIAPGVRIDDAAVGALAELLAAMPPNLVSGETGFDGTALFGTGVYVDEQALAAFDAVAVDVSAAVELSPRPTASAEEAAGLEAELNAFVAANPILFTQGSDTLSPQTLATLDQLAGIAERFAGVTVTIEGHTDSDGDADDNQALGERRAAAVLEALAARGVPPGDLASEGLGETQPVVIDGVEDKAASRRVAFRVSTSAGA